MPLSLALVVLLVLARYGCALTRRSPVIRALLDAIRPGGW
jgi:hypothetical protein